MGNSKSIASTAAADDPGPKISPKPNSSLRNEDETYPAKRVCLSTGVNEGEEEPVQYAPTFSQRHNSGNQEETIRTLEKRIRDKDKEMQQTAHDYLAFIYQEHEKALKNLEAQRKEYEKRDKYLDNCQALNQTERRKLESQKEKYLMATQEQIKAYEVMLRLVGQQQREKDELCKKVSELEHKLDANQESKLDLEHLRDDLQLGMLLRATRTRIRPCPHKARICYAHIKPA